MRAALWVMLGIACVASAPPGAFGGWVGDTMCACPGMAKPLGNYATCEDACYGTQSSPGGGNPTPGYDYEAERQRQAEADRIERERKAEIKRKKEAEFIRKRDASAKTFKGSSSPAMNQLKGLADTDSSGLKGSGFDTGRTGLKELRGSYPADRKARSKPAPHGDTSVVDARNVPTGLPKSVEKAIPRTPAGDRVRKGFQAITERDWKVALAWFQDALNHEPGSPGLKRLVDLAQFTLQRQSDPAAKPTGAATTVTKGKTGKILKTGMGEELNRSLNDYYKYNPPKNFYKYLKPGKAIQSDTEWLNEKEPAWKNFFRLLTPTFKIKQDGSATFGGIRG